MNELIGMTNAKRENVKLENSIIKGGAYKAGEDPTKRKVMPEISAEVPYLDFSPLQNAVRYFGKSIEQLHLIYGNGMENDSISDTINKSLFRAEQQLLIKTGLPRREWYKHSLYAPGSYTGYGVKTFPGIREAIEQGNWDEAQEQIKVASGIIVNLGEYFNSLTSSE